jgi:hypothetical protein
VKCLSLWQPWASLVVLGEKRIETRGWATSHRGPLAIHAAIARSDAKRLALVEPFVSTLRRGGLEAVDGKPSPAMPFGSIIGIANLVDCRLMIDDHDYRASDPDAWGVMVMPPMPELAFGRYEPGRYGWFLEGVRAMPPVPFRGLQRIFNVPDELMRGAA